MSLEDVFVNSVYKGRTFLVMIQCVLMFGLTCQLLANFCQTEDQNALKLIMFVLFASFMTFDYIVCLCCLCLCISIVLHLPIF